MSNSNADGVLNEYPVVFPSVTDSAKRDGLPLAGRGRLPQLEPHASTKTLSDVARAASFSSSSDVSLPARRSRDSSSHVR